MSLKAILAVLVLGSSSLAIASTYAGGKPYVSASRVHQRWVPLTEPTRIDGGHETIHIDAGAGRFSKLRLFNNRGSSYVQKVVIEFAGGGAQMVRIDALLTSTSPMTIDLVGGYRAIARITVHGVSSQGSAYQVLAL